MSKTKPLLTVTNVSSGYGRVTILNDISITVAEGEMVSIIGANGAGKTTLLKTLSGLIECTAGSIVYDSIDLTKTPAHIRPALGLALVPEGRQIFPRLSVLENLELGAYCRVAPAQEIAQDIEAQFTLFPILESRRAQLGGTLSGGEQQMLAMARALMSRPKLLLLDEPSMGVAPLIVEKIFTTLAELQKSGLTILVVEQNASLALAQSDRGYVIELGRIQYGGTGKELLSDSRIRETYLGH
jgi:branched-chain amino acid transport system ATP-binding protein